MGDVLERVCLEAWFPLFSYGNPGGEEQESVLAGDLLAAQTGELVPLYGEWAALSDGGTGAGAEKGSGVGGEQPLPVGARADGGEAAEGAESRKTESQEAESRESESRKTESQEAESQGAETREAESREGEIPEEDQEPVEDPQTARRQRLDSLPLLALAQPSGDGGGKGAEDAGSASGAGEKGSGEAAPGAEGGPGESNLPGETASAGAALSQTADPPADQAWETVSGTAEAAGFAKHTRQNALDLSALASYENLVSAFYTVDSTAMVGSDQLDALRLDAVDLTVSKESPGPQILIYHTHSKEAFADSRPGEVSDTIVGVGEHLAQILETEYGYQVLHNTESFDAETRDNAYSRSLPVIQQVLADNPSIQVVIDLHRDGIDENAERLVVDLDGRPTARFMFFNGVSRTKKTGEISYLYNENLDSNLAFSFQMKKTAEEYYPGLTRKNYIKAYRYNMHLCPRSLLIELGAQTNTLQEAMNACDPMAHILDLVLTGERQ